MTPILNWEKPKKIMSEPERQQTHSADSAVPGVYVPNMSDTDIASWKARWKYKNTDHPQIEIRKDSFVIIVSLNGYKYRHYDTDKHHIHIASAGPIQFTWEEYAEMQIAIEEAKLELQKLL